MRRGNTPEMVMNDDKFLGVNMSWDFTTEHEWGIKELQQAFGFKTKLTKRTAGFSRRKAHIFPEDCMLFEREGDEAVLVYTHVLSWDKTANAERWFKHHDLHMFGDKGLACAWSNDDFGIRVKGESRIKALEELWEAFKRKDIVIYFNKDGKPFSNAGLVIAIHSRMPEHIMEQAKQSDLDIIALQKADKKTGIKKKVDKINSAWLKKNPESYRSYAPVAYIALSPRWTSEDMKDKTKHDVVYWLNPQNQQEVNYGLFTVEDIEQWIDGKGPIPMTEEQKKEMQERYA